MKTIGEMTKVSIYRDIYDTTSDYIITVDAALDRIKKGKSLQQVVIVRNEPNEDKQKDLKAKLPSITFSGIFKVREDEYIKTHSGFICLDFDDVNITDCKKQFTEWNFTYACWVSPSGTGIKVLIRIADGKKHREHFAALQKMYPKADPKCANPSRVCYESYDPEIFINLSADVFKDAIKFEVISNVTVAADSFEVYQKLKAWMEKRGRVFSTGNRNFYIYVIAGAMCRYGIAEDQAVQMLKTEFASQSFNEKEISQSSHSAYKKNRDKFGSCEFSNEKFSSKETKYEVDPKVFEDGYKLSDVVYGTDVYDEAVEIYEHGYKSAETTFIPQLDEFWKWKRGELNLLTGIGNYGKTSYITQLKLIRSLKANNKWAVFSPENNPPAEYYFDITEMLLGARSDGKTTDKPNRKKFDDAYRFVSEHFFYIYPDGISPSPEFIKTKFLELIIKEKVDGVCIDPFNQLANDYKNTRSDKYLETFLSDCQRFAVDNNIFFLLVAHPHKLNKENNGNYPCPDVYDIADGAMWNNKCDNIIVYHRPVAQTDPDAPICEHHSKKIRRQKMIGKKGFFDFTLNRARRRFYFNGFSPLDGNTFEVAAPEQLKLHTINPNKDAERNFDYSQVPDKDVPF